MDEDWRAAEASSETVNLHSGSEVLATPARVAILSTGDLVLRDILATEEGPLFCSSRSSSVIPSRSQFSFFCGEEDLERLGAGFRTLLFQGGVVLVL